MVKSFYSSAATMMSNFSCQYNFGSITLALVIMSASECTETQSNCLKGKQQLWVHSATSAMVFIGAVVGQLSMGYLGDLLGRNRAFFGTMLLACLSAAFQAFSPPYGSNDAKTVYSIIALFRFFLGLGLGGIYPLSATKSSEDDTNDSYYGIDKRPIYSKNAAWSYFWQIPGSIAPWIVGALLGCTSHLSDSDKWRLLLGLGAVPSAITILFIILDDMSNDKNSNNVKSVTVGRDSNASVGSTMNSTTAYGEAADRGKSHSTSEVNSFLKDALHEKENVYKLIGAGVTWFLYDILLYGISLLSGTIIDKIDGNITNVSSNSNIRILSGKVLISLVVFIPGVIFSIYLLDAIGVKSLQMLGFAFMTLSSALMAGLFYPLIDSNPNGLYALYCFLSFTLSLGVPLTTFMLPAIIFKKNIRGTLNGIW